MLAGGWVRCWLVVLCCCRAAARCWLGECGEGLPHTRERERERFENHTHQGVNIATTMTTTTLFVGLGPRGREVTSERLAEYLGQHAAVGDVRCVGTRAFVEVASEAAARELIAKCHGQYLDGSIRLVVKIDEPREEREGGGEWARGDAGRGAHGAYPRGGARGGRGGRSEGAGGQTTLFVGLGPRGAEVAEEELRRVIGAHATVGGVRHRGGTAFVDVGSAAEAAAAIGALHGATLSNGVRLSVRVDGGRPRA